MEEATVPVDLKIRQYKKYLEKYTDRTPDQTVEIKLLHVFMKLEKLPITLHHLQETGVGKTVNIFRKHDGKIGERAKEVVNRWKQLVPSAPNSRESTPSIQCETESETVYDEKKHAKRLENKTDSNNFKEKNIAEVVTEKLRESKHHHDKHDVKHYKDDGYGYRSANKHKSRPETRDSGKHKNASRHDGNSNEEQTSKDRKSHSHRDSRHHLASDGDSLEDERKSKHKNPDSHKKSTHQSDNDRDSLEDVKKSKQRKSDSDKRSKHLVDSNRESLEVEPKSKDKKSHSKEKIKYHQDGHSKDKLRHKKERIIEKKHSAPEHLCDSTDIKKHKHHINKDSAHKQKYSTCLDDASNADIKIKAEVDKAIIKEEAPMVSIESKHGEDKFGAIGSKSKNIKKEQEDQKLKSLGQGSEQYLKKDIIECMHTSMKDNIKMEDIKEEIESSLFESLTNDVEMADSGNGLPDLEDAEKALGIMVGDNSSREIGDELKKKLKSSSCIKNNIKGSKSNKEDCLPDIKPSKSTLQDSLVQYSSSRTESAASAPSKNKHNDSNVLQMDDEPSLSFEDLFNYDKQLAKKAKKKGHSEKTSSQKSHGMDTKHTHKVEKSHKHSDRSKDDKKHSHHHSSKDSSKSKTSHTSKHRDKSKDSQSLDRTESSHKSTSQKRKSEDTHKKGSHDHHHSRDKHAGVRNSSSLEKVKVKEEFDMPPPPKIPRLTEEDFVSAILPQTSSHYTPLSRPPPLNEEDEMKRLEKMMGEKRDGRTAVFSGKKRQVMLPSVPTLKNACYRVLLDNIESLDYVGGVPADVLMPVLEKCNPSQLYTLEDANPHFVGDTETLWKILSEKDFRTKKREEFEGWRELYLRCHDEREEKLKNLSATIATAVHRTQDQTKKTKMAYVDVVAKPPRGVRRQQLKHGTAGPAGKVNHLAKLGHSSGSSVMAPRSATGPNPLLHRPGLLARKPVPDMMQKTMKMMKNLRR